MPFIDLNFPTSGTTGDAIVTFQAICPSDVIVGDVVYISGDRVGSLFQVAKVDIKTTHKMPAKGLVAQKLTSTTCVVMCMGEAIGIYTGLTPNATLFADETARLSEAAPGPPSIGIVNVQSIAHALASDTIFVRVENPTRRVSG